MIERYTRAPMGAVWTQGNRFQKMFEVECAAAEAQAELNLIPAKAAKEIRTRGRFSVDRILEIEKTTKHDVIAFVSNVAENVGPLGRYVHFGLTSSDVLDTALSLLIRDAGRILLESLERLESALLKRAQECADVICAGRTHGMHAEPTTFGMKFAGFWAECGRNRERLERALEQTAIAKLSGAVGTYSTQTHLVEDGVCRKLGLKRELIATQVVPRDRHAEVLWALAMIGGGIERLAIELRHLQRTEVGEAIEGFTKGQKGSSAMPHKKNPISAENLTGCARLLRAYAGAGLENIALWHERDISHSAVERVTFPDAFILCDYAVDRAARLVEGLELVPERMLENMDLSQGALFSSHLLLALVEKGLSREEAYALVQRLSHGLKKGEHLREVALSDKEARGLLNEREIRSIFEGERHRIAIRGALERAGVLARGKRAKTSPQAASRVKRAKPVKSSKQVKQRTGVGNAN